MDHPWIVLPGVFFDIPFESFANIPFQQGANRFGKEPRSTHFSMDGDDLENKSYWYSGKRNRPQPMDEITQHIRDRVVALAKEHLPKQYSDMIDSYPFKTALFNLYRGGNDSIGAHSDDEKEIVPGSPIASLSFGASRDFRFIPKDKHCKPITLELKHGDLLFMFGSCQDEWKHEIPKRKNITQPRVNITFRSFDPSRVKAKEEREKKKRKLEP